MIMIDSCGTVHWAWKCAELCIKGTCVNVNWQIKRFKTWDSNARPSVHRSVALLTEISEQPVMGLVIRHISLLQLKIHADCVNFNGQTNWITTIHVPEVQEMPTWDRRILASWPLPSARSWSLGSFSLFSPCPWGLGPRLPGAALPPHPGDRTASWCGRRQSAGLAEMAK